MTNDIFEDLQIFRCQGFNEFEGEKENINRSINPVVDRVTVVMSSSTMINVL